MVFLSPLYSLVSKILDWGLNQVTGTLPGTSSTGYFSYCLFFPHFKFLYLYHEQAENHNIEGDFFFAYSHLCFVKKKKKQHINIHTLSKQTDCCLAEVLIT